MSNDLFIYDVRNYKICYIFVREISNKAAYMALDFQFSSLAAFVLNLLWSFSAVSLGHNN